MRPLPLLLFVCCLSIAASARAEVTPDYRTLQADPRVPRFAHEEQEEDSWTVQDDLVDLGDLMDGAAFRRAQPLVTRVYADVVKVPAGFDQTLRGQVLLVVARRVEVEADARLRLDLTGDANAALDVYAAEWSGALEVLASADFPGQLDPSFLLDGAGALEQLVFHDGTAVAFESYDELPDELFAPAGLLEHQLERASLVANLLPTAALRERMELLDWVLTMASRAPARLARGSFDRLAADAAAQLAFEHARASGRHVPWLDAEVYGAVGSAYLTALELYEAQYDRFVDRALSTDQRQAAADLMVAQAQAASAQKEAYLEQAQAGVDIAREAVAKASLAFEERRVDNELGRIAFEAGLERWKQEQALLTAFKAIEAFVGVVGMLAGGLTFKVLPEKDQIFQAIKSVGDIARSTAATLSSVQQAVQLGLTLEKGSGALAAAVEGGRTDELIAASRELTSLESNLLFVDEAWTRLAIESRGMLKFAIDAKVGGASKYQTSFELLALSGQTLLDAQRNLARAQLEVVQLVSSLALDRGFAQRARALSAELGESAQADRDLSAHLAAGMAELKRPLQLALRNYAAAYEYWALRPADEPPSLLDGAAAFRRHFASLARAYERALVGFARPPQPFRELRVVVDDAERLARFRESGELTLDVGQDEAAFAGLERVRLAGVRVWFEGARCPARRCLAQVTTSGQYEDRLNGVRSTFQGPPLWRMFAYESREPSPPMVLVDGTLADRFAFAYFEPTPFTRWTVQLSDRANPGLDRSSVTSVTLEWSGSAIGAAF